MGYDLVFIKFLGRIPHSLRYCCSTHNEGFWILSLAPFPPILTRRLGVFQVPRPVGEGFRVRAKGSLTVSLAAGMNAPILTCNMIQHHATITPQ